MNVFEAIKARYSVRSYQDRPVEDEKLGRLLEAARLAPSAANRQEWRFVVVRDAAKRRELMEAANGQKFVAEAPVVIVACAVGEDRKLDCGGALWVLDVGIALEHIALQAVEEGLGTCWIGAFSQARVRQALGIPDDVRVVELMPVGYPADRPREKNRLPLDEIVRYEAWTA